MTLIEADKKLAKQVSELNWELSGHIDAGGGLFELKRWIEAMLQDHQNKTIKQQ